MRFVPVKFVGQQAALSLHRVEQSSCVCRHWLQGRLQAIINRKDGEDGSRFGVHLMSMIRRRDLLKAAAAATLAGGLTPCIGQAESAKTLRFVGVADLSVLDPVVTGARPTRNAAYLIFDTLYGLDTEWQAQPQMVAGHSVDNDGWCGT